MFELICLEWKILIQPLLMFLCSTNPHLAEVGSLRVRVKESWKNEIFNSISMSWATEKMLALLERICTFQVGPRSLDTLYHAKLSHILRKSS